MNGFFTEKTQSQFLEALTTWSRETLGCQLISQPWVSSYVEGCYQNFHTDVPHGPYSFVYSLSKPNKKAPFQGGNTLVARHELITLPASPDFSSSQEFSSFFHSIDPAFNRLIVFDPRYPHGVSRVSNCDDVLDSRVVIHGWFTQPRTMSQGSLQGKKLEKALNALVLPWLEENPRNWMGLLSVRLEVNAPGDIQAVTVLCAHLINPQGESIQLVELKDWIRFAILESGFRFPKSSGRTEITIPIQF